METQTDAVKLQDARNKCHELFGRLHATNLWSHSIWTDWHALERQGEYAQILPDFESMWPGRLADWIYERSNDAPLEELRDMHKHDLEALADELALKDDSWRPAMNYRYPIELFDMDERKAQCALIDTSVCLVTAPDDPVGDAHYLALTGGGMDLSWDIAHAYAKLGQLPPLWVARDLPAIVRTPLEGVDLATFGACQIALETAQDLLTNHRWWQCSRFEVER